MTMTELPPPAGVAQNPPNVAASWRIHWRGRSWTDADLTGQHLATLALMSGDDRFADLALLPNMGTYPAEGYMRLMNMLVTFLTVDATRGLTDADEATDMTARVLKSVQEASADEILGCIEFA